MYTPTSTYRLQLHAGFQLADASNIISYLEKLGISTLYASPCFKARKGSMHGYDVTNPHEINPEIGTFKEFEEVIRPAAEKRDRLATGYGAQSYGFFYRKPLDERRAGKRRKFPILFFL